MIQALPFKSLKTLRQNQPLPAKSAHIQSPISFGADQVSIRFGAQDLSQSAVNKAITESSQTFSNNMLSAMAPTATTQNTIVSPSNTYLLMQLLQTGSTGETATEIRNAMGLTGLFNKGATKDQVVAGVSNYISEMTQLMADTGITLEQAYGIWAAPGRTWHPDFANRVARLKGESGTLEGAEQINNWAAQKTHDKIKSIVSDDEVADAACVLASATYLLSNWRTQFDENFTYPQTFNGANGEKTVEMMHQTADFKTLQNDDSVPYDAINLPYGEANADPAKNELSMSIFLPKQGESVATAYNHLFAQSGLKSAVEKLNQTGAGEVELAMPKYVLESTTDTKQVMQQMGIQSAFAPGAGFDEMMPIHIGMMRQKAFIDVNEKGTEAAAVDVAVGFECVRMTNQFTVDKPFISVIHDKQGRVLFVSTVHDIPEKAAD